MKKILLFVAIVVAAVLALVWYRRRTTTPALQVGPNPVLKQSDNVRPNNILAPAFVQLAQKVPGWFSQPSNVVSNAPAVEYDFDDVAQSYALPGSYGSDEEDPY